MNSCISITRDQGGSDKVSGKRICTPTTYVDHAAAKLLSFSTTNTIFRFAEPGRRVSAKTQLKFGHSSGFGTPIKHFLVRVHHKISHLWPEHTTKHARRIEALWTQYHRRIGSAAPNCLHCPLLSPKSSTFFRLSKGVSTDLGSSGMQNATTMSLRFLGMLNARTSLR